MLIAWEYSLRQPQGMAHSQVALAHEEIYREVRQNHGFEEFHCRNFNAIYGHVALSFLSHLCLTVTRLMTPKLRSLTLGKIKHKVFNALVELVSTADQMTVCFTDEFLERYGLPAFCT